MTLLLALLMLSDAHAGWPEDVSVSSFSELDGTRELDTSLLRGAYTQLVRELGTMVANKPVNPTATTGIHGWEVSAYSQFILTEAHDRAGEPSPWERAHPDGEPQTWHLLPTLGFRKGLPLSSEVGANLAWIGRTRTGAVGGYGRIALLENHKPWPDLTLQAGYSGYIGNDELQVGTTDLGVSMGTTWYTGRVRGAHNAAVSPWVSFTSLHIRANPRVDAETLERTGAVPVQKRKSPDDQGLDPLTLPQVAAGVQITSQNVHMRVVGTWAPQTIPTLSTGMGFTF